MKYLHNQIGFSLIEIMVALVLGLTLVMAFTGALIVGLQTEGRMDDRLEATRVIDSVIEELRNEDLSGVESEADLKDEIVDLLQEGLYIPDGYPKEIDDNDNLYNIKISWPDRNYSKETFVATGVTATGEEDDDEEDEDEEDDGDAIPANIAFVTYGNNEITLKVEDEEGNPVSGVKIEGDYSLENNSHIEHEGGTSWQPNTTDENGEKTLTYEELKNTHNVHSRKEKVKFEITGYDVSLELEITVGTDNKINNID